MCVQSRLGYVVLCLALLHVAIVARFWRDYTLEKFLQSRKTLSCVLPVLVLVVKLVFSLPPLSGHLRKIRRGWERPVSRRRGSCCRPEANPYTSVEMSAVHKF